MIRLFQLKDVPAKELSTKIDTMVGDFDLKDKIDTVAMHLSGGMKRKLSVAMALIGNAKVINFYA